MEAEGDFSSYAFKAELEEELENIASDLRRLIFQEIETTNDGKEARQVGAEFSGLDSYFDGDLSCTSSVSGTGIRRIFDDTSIASSSDSLDWRPLFDSVEDVKTKDEATSFSQSNIGQLVEEEKVVATSSSDLGMKRLFKEGRVAQESLRDLGMQKLFKEDKATAESLSDLNMQRLFKEGKATAESLSDLGMKLLFQRSEEKLDAAELNSAQKASMEAATAVIAKKYAEIRARKKLVARRRIPRPSTRAEKVAAGKMMIRPTVDDPTEGEEAAEKKVPKERKSGEGEKEDNVSSGEEAGNNGKGLPVGDGGADGEGVTEEQKYENDEGVGEEEKEEEEAVDCVNYDDDHEVADDENDSEVESDKNEENVVDDANAQHPAFKWFYELYSSVIFWFYWKLSACDDEEEIDGDEEEIDDETVKGFEWLLDIFFVFLTLFFAVAVALTIQEGDFSVRER